MPPIGADHQIGANLVQRVIDVSALGVCFVSTSPLVEGAPVTVIQMTKPRPATAAVPAASGGNGGARVDPVAQRARDSDARRILEGELRSEEEKLAVMQKEFNNGQPERQGDEKNFQKYLDRVEQMRAAIARKQTDIAALQREIKKLPPPLPQ